MPTRDVAPIGHPCWADLFTTDPERATAFYGELFGWTADEPNAEFGGYTNFRKDGLVVAGLMGNDGSVDTPDMWSIYLAVDDAQKTADAVTANGGLVHSPPVVVGDLGTMALFADCTGAAIGVWQPGEHKGFGVLAEPGSPGWFELHTRDYEQALAFYRNVFSWDTHVVADEAEFRYSTLGEDESAAAGIMDASSFLPEGVPAHWSVYFAVADTDAALAQVTALGGAVVQPAEDTPYGRLAVATDPTGAVFKLVG